MADQQAGDRLGPYELLSILGSGGMGVVWKARDTRLDRIVAIKRLTLPHRDRFAQEARAIAALNHPHICQVHDVGPDYLVLEYIDGVPLQGPVSTEIALRLGTQIADALCAAHRRGILHRDLKPGNVIVTAEGSVKLLDFGLAKLLDSGADVTKTLDGTVLGTAAYMAPEQADGKPTDARSDIFSFGAVLYELLSGGRAFAGSTTAQVLSAVLRDEPQALQAPPALERIVMRCLAKRPEDRFQTMDEVKAALEQVATKPPDPGPSIAVLPFANMSGDKEQEYFSDGLAEEIINELAHIPGLKVTARTSAFAFRGKEQDITKIAEALRVRTILEGSVRRAGNRIRVTAQLINADDGYHLWSERYDRELTDVFAIQDEIARAIASALQLRLSSKPGTERSYTPSFPAYEAYLKGRHYLYKMTAESVPRSRPFFEEAINLDPRFAAAHANLGEYFAVSGSFGLLPAGEAAASARAAARKALEIDRSLPDAHLVLGWVASMWDFDWNEVDREFRLAMAIEPVSPWVRDQYGAFYLLQVGRVSEAGQQIERALQEDPLNLLMQVHLGVYLLAAGRYVDATAQFQQVLDIDPSYSLAHMWLIITFAQRGMLADARVSAERAFALAPSPLVIGGLAGALRLTGDEERAKQLLGRLTGVEGRPAALVMFHLMCSEVDEAIEWLERMIEEHTPAPLLPVIFRRLCGSSPRWPAVAKLMNLS